MLPDVRKCPLLAGKCIYQHRQYKLMEKTLKLSNVINFIFDNQCLLSIIVENSKGRFATAKQKSNLQNGNPFP